MHWKCLRNVNWLLSDKDNTYYSHPWKDTKEIQFSLCSQWIFNNIEKIKCIYTQQQKCSVIWWAVILAWGALFLSAPLAQRTYYRYTVNVCCTSTDYKLCCLETGRMKQCYILSHEESQKYASWKKEGTYKGSPSVWFCLPDMFSKGKLKVVESRWVVTWGWRRE